MAQKHLKKKIRKRKKIGRTPKLQMTAREKTREFLQSRVPVDRLIGITIPKEFVIKMGFESRKTPLPVYGKEWQIWNQLVRPVLREGPLAQVMINRLNGKKIEEVRRQMEIESATITTLALEVREAKKAGTKKYIKAVQKYAPHVHNYVLMEAMTARLFMDRFFTRFSKEFKERVVSEIGMGFNVFDPYQYTKLVASIRKADREASAKKTVKNKMSKPITSVVQAKAVTKSKVPRNKRKAEYDRRAVAGRNRLTSVYTRITGHEPPKAIQTKIAKLSPDNAKQILERLRTVKTGSGKTLTGSNIVKINRIITG